MNFQVDFKIRKAYARGLGEWLIRRHIGNKTFFSNNIGITRRHLHYILKGERYPGKRLHSIINKELGINLPYNKLPKNESFIANRTMASPIQLN